MIAIAPNQFMLESSAGTRLEFAPEGAGIRSFDLMRADRSRLTVHRTF